MDDNFVGIIDGLDWNSDKDCITIDGYCYIRGKSQGSNSSVKKSIIIECGDKKYTLPLKNVMRSDINNGLKDADYSFCGFSGLIDLGYIDNMDGLDIGDWKLRINLRVDDVELTEDLKYVGSVNNLVPKSFESNRHRCFVDVTPTVRDGKLYLCSKQSLTNDKYKRETPTKVFIDGLKLFKDTTKRAINMKIYNVLKSKPINENSIVFLSDSRSELSGNFKFVYDEIMRRGNYDIQMFLKPSIGSKWSFKDKIGFLKAVSTSKYILLDDYYPKIYGFKLREEIELIQLWHACGAFKTFGFSRLGKEGGPKVRAKTHRNYTKAFVSSDEIRKHYAEGFGISEDRVYATGVPRTDVFFDDEYKSSKVKELKKKYPLLENKKVIMFAPTFRGHGQLTAYYDFDKLNIEKLYEEFGKEYVIIMKLHPFVKDVPKIEEKYRDFIIDLTSEREINDLLFISDILITDYSSVCFEYSLLNRPMIFFAYDMDEYIDKRDFYYPYQGFVPGPIAKTTDDIINIIKTEDYKLDKLENFRNRFFNDFDGKSTQRVVDIILGSNKK